MLLKGLGARSGTAGSTAAGAGDRVEFARELGFRARVADGSGLSRANSISPRDVGRLLVEAQDEPWFDSFYRSLPLAGKSGTLDKRMRGTRRIGPLPRQDRHALRRQRPGRLLQDTQRQARRVRPAHERRERLDRPPHPGPDRGGTGALHRLARGPQGEGSLRKPCRRVPSDPSPGGPP